MERKRVFRIYATIVMMVLLIGLFPQINAQAATVKLSETKKTVYTGETFELVLKNAKKTVKWKSSNTSVVKVDNNGRVTAIGSGTAKITAKYKSATYTCKITVKAPHISCKSAELYVDGTILLQMLGTNVTRWISYDETVASVDSNGLVTALSEGKTTIKAICTNDKTYKCEVKVEEMNENAVPVISLDYMNKSGYLWFNGQGPDWDLTYNRKSDYSKDNLGNMHDNVFSMGIGGYDGYVTYKINGEYERLTGIYYIIYRYRDGDSGLKLYIYGDGIKLWEGKIGAGIEPKEFNVSVKDIDILEIKSENGMFSCAIGDFYLIP